MAKVLIVGGAGYIGSTNCAWLLNHNHDVWVLDDLSTGHLDLILPQIKNERKFLLARAGDREKVLPFLKEQRFDCVMHFAARALVGESVLKPQEYFENNVTQTENLIEMMLEAGTTRFIFSSTCAIFGDPTDFVFQDGKWTGISEETPKNPVNPYGESKLRAEQVIQRFCNDRALAAISLRYFNACGAEVGMRTGECHHPESHLIPNILLSLLNNGVLNVYGTDYPTPDGTAIRDYIHVSDLAQAHESAMNRLLSYEPRSAFEAFNLGSENGYSVKEIIASTERVTGKKVRVSLQSRRPGDPPRLVAQSTLAKKYLNFGKDPLQNIDSILQSAWTWHSFHQSKVIQHKAVFIDRDGTINFDPGYLYNPNELTLLEGVGDALLRLKRAGFMIIVVTNQSGVGRGKFTLEQLQQLHLRLDEILMQYGVKIDEYQICIHAPSENCSCRKPSPQLIHEAAARNKIELKSSYMIGDKDTDILAGKNAGCRKNILVRTGYGQETETWALAEKEKIKQDDWIAFDSLSQGVDWILSQSVD